MNYPRHKYLGPGNPTENGKPVDKADEIAKTHDEEYDRARTSQDIRQADRAAIGSFTGDFLEHGSVPSLVGAAGLGVKYGVESVTGVLYPGNIGGMCFKRKLTRELLILLVLIVLRISLKELVQHLVV